MKTFYLIILALLSCKLNFGILKVKLCDSNVPKLFK